MGRRIIDARFYHFKLQDFTHPDNRFKFEGIPYTKGEVENAVLCRKSISRDIYLTELLSRVYEECFFVGLVRNGFALCEGWVRRGRSSQACGRAYREIGEKMIEDSQGYEHYLIVREGYSYACADSVHSWDVTCQVASRGKRLFKQSRYDLADTRFAESPEETMRICRMMTEYPSSELPGGGLPAYFMCQHIHWPTLMITEKRRGTFRRPPANTQLVRIPFWDTSISQYRGLRRICRLLIKASGNAIYLLQSLVPALYFRPDIVHVHTAQLLPHGIVMKFLLKTPLCVTIHGSDMIFIEQSRLWRRLIRLADRVFYVSKSMVERLEPLVPQESLVYSPSGVDLSLFRNMRTPRKPYVVMVGSFKWQKGYEYAFLAFKKFLVTHPDWKLTIIGEGPQGTQLMALADELNIRDWVEWKGTQTREQVCQCLNEGRIFLLSSVSEGFPKVVLEAAACGLPMVVTDVGSSREIANQAGLVVSPKDSNALAGALVRLADDNDLWEFCAESAERMAEKYSWEHTAAIVAQVYEELLSEGRAE